MLPQPGGRAPRSGEAWITAGSQAPSQDRGEGPEGYMLLQTLSGLSEAINSPGPSPQSSGQSLGKMGNHKGCKDPISLLWLKHCSSSFARADITRSLFYKCRGPWIEQYPVLPSRGGPGSRASSRTSSLEPSTHLGLLQPPTHTLAFPGRITSEARATSFEGEEDSQEVQLRMGARVIWPSFLPKAGIP